MPMNIDERIEVLEQRLAVMERLFRTATGQDPNLTEDIAAIYGVIAESPGMSQTGVCLAARERFEFLSRSRVIDILRNGAGQHWRVEGGAYNSLLYFPLHNAGRMQADAEQAGACIARSETTQS